MRSSSAIRTAVLALAAALVPAASQAAVIITIAPPVLPIYVQPMIPVDGYMWTPGYWAYGDEGYFWVPGVWVQPPSVGVLWTPGYWGWGGGVYSWNAGYWGPTVGFYGGVNYGYGFSGVGFEGGRWDGGHFSYNTAVANVGGVSVHGSYRANVSSNNVRTSFNGGSGGLTSRPSANERTAMGAHHTAATSAQTAHHAAAAQDRSQLASVNHGSPSNAAMSRPAAAANHSAPAAANHSAPAVNHSAPAANHSAPATNHSAPAANSRPAPANRPAGGGGGGGGQPKGNSQPASRPAAAQHPGNPKK